MVPNGKAFFFRYVYASLVLQYLYGGLYLPFDGVLLNPMDYVMPVGHTDLFETNAVLEFLIGEDEHPVALTREDFEKTIFQRSWMDRGEGYTCVCIQVRYYFNDLIEYILVLIWLVRIMPSVLF